MKPSEGQKVVFPRRFAQKVSAIYGSASQGEVAVADSAKCPVGAVLGTADPSGPVRRQWRLLLELLQIFTPSLEREWEVDLTLTGDGVELQGIAGGDGRRFDADRIVVAGEFASDAEYQLAVARAMAERAAELEGKPKE